MLNLQHTVDQTIPVYLPEEKFNTFVLPLLWQGQRGPKPKIDLYRTFHYVLYVLYTGCQWKMLPIARNESGEAEIHYTRVWHKWKQWVEHKSIAALFEESVRQLQQQGQLDTSLLHGDGTNVVAKKGGDISGYSGHKHQTGNKVLAIHDNAGNVLAGATIAAVNQSDMTLLPTALRDLKRTLKRCGITIPKTTPLNLDAGFDSRKNRKLIWNARLKPNIKENPRNRKRPKRGRKRYFDETLYKQRFKCERTFGWQDKFRKVIIKTEWYQHLFNGFNLLAFTLINLRNLQF